ncbi:hypothetical protein H6796_01000 [Candidatus Nomurabacteria bacterium]|nr:hypothetical protein [Candidatus Nomurabacteria bacterium]
MESSPVERSPSLNPAEYSPVTQSQEVSPDTTSPYEREAQAGERAANPVSSVPPATPLPPQLPQAVNQQAGDDATSVTDDNLGPAVANDDDLIEKEWVDQAKKIIAQTRDDPHAQEAQVGRLQEDYLQKRYGKTLGSSE